VLEGMTVCRVRGGCRQGYIYVRVSTRGDGEADHAIRIAREQKLLGDDILGSDFQFDVELRARRGAYICGEETALFNSSKATAASAQQTPFPTQSGLIPQADGGEQCRDADQHSGNYIGRAEQRTRRLAQRNSCGYRLFCVSGSVNRRACTKRRMGQRSGK